MEKIQKQKREERKWGGGRTTRGGRSVRTGEVTRDQEGRD